MGKKKKEKRKESEGATKEEVTSVEKNDDDVESDGDNDKSKKSKMDDDQDEEVEESGNQKKREKKGMKAAENDMLMELAEERAKFLDKQKKDRMLKKGEGRQDQTLALLASFQSKVTNMISQESDDENEIEDGEVAEKGLSWASHKLKFDDHRDAKDAN